jgi:hypothetical protein
MRKLLIIMIAAMVMAVGCTKKDGADTSPSPSATAAPSASSPGGASATPGASPTGSAGTATAAPGGGTATTAPAKLTSITQEQMDKLDMKSTVDDLLKIAGKDLKPVKEADGKKTYEVKIADKPNTYLNVTYFNDGKMDEKNVFTR